VFEAFFALFRHAEAAAVNAIETRLKNCRRDFAICAPPDIVSGPIRVVAHGNGAAALWQSECPRQTVCHHGTMAWDATSVELAFVLPTYHNKEIRNFY
jgi:hypothetical protein